MHIALIFFVTAGQVATAIDPHFSHSPRGTISDDNLATITALSDGHLPTCFTGHPTIPCPTNGPQSKRDLAGNPLAGHPMAGNPMGDLPGHLNEVARIVPIKQIEVTASGGKPSMPAHTPRVGPRDAPPKIANKDYIPEPNEWEIPGNFTFTESIVHNATGTTASPDSLTMSSTEESQVATPTATSSLNEQLDHYNKHYAHHHNNNVHYDNHCNDRQEQSDNYVHTSAVSESIPGNAYSQTTDLAALPSISQKQHDVANSSSEAQVAGSIGTLLSAAMFPGKMRAPATTKISPYAITATTSCTSSSYGVSEASSSHSAGPAYDVRPVTMVTSPRPVALSEAQPTASHKADEQAQLQNTARHLVS